MIERNFNLKPFNTFGIDCFAAKFGTFKNVEELKRLLSAKDKDEETFILGGGSNILFTKDFEGLVIKMEMKGIQLLKETPREVLISVGAGENWHLLVKYCVQKAWGGIENLSLIPGTVGAAPIQNIGAYGVEAKETIQQITAYDTHTKQWVILDNDACQFSYRNSLFKKEKNRYIIAEVQFLLQKQPRACQGARLVSVVRRLWVDLVLGNLYFAFHLADRLRCSANSGALACDARRTG